VIADDIVGSLVLIPRLGLIAAAFSRAAAAVVSALPLPGLMRWRLDVRLWEPVAAAVVSALPQPGLMRWRLDVRLW